MKLETSQDYLNGILKKNRSVLGQAITLVESKNSKHQIIARELIQKILPLTGKAKRVGISGTPGVGKSTFIENFGMFLIQKKMDVAVLAVDPTSQKTGGSILGDKTRMEHLSSSDHAFIRPSPSGDTLGGITAKTREALLLCDAFGFDYILVETVGVGQSEISVSHLTDMFILLMQPGAGDELQGIKRGILEVSDLVLINKADGDHKKQATLSQHDYQKSIEVLQHEKEWQTKVLLCSALEKQGFKEIHLLIDDFYKKFDLKKRSDQLENWLKDILLDLFKTKLSQLTSLETMVGKVSSGEVDIISASDHLYKEIMENK